MIIHIQVEKIDRFGYQATINKDTGMYATGASVQEAVLKARAVALGWLSTEILVNGGIRPDDSNSIVFTVHCEPEAPKVGPVGKMPMPGQGDSEKPVSLRPIGLQPVGLKPVGAEAPLAKPSPTPPPK